MTTEKELEGIEAAALMAEKARKLARIFAAQQYMAQTLGLDMDAAMKEAAKDAEAIVGYLRYIEATFKDPVQLIRFVRGEHQTFRGSF